MRSLLTAWTLLICFGLMGQQNQQTYLDAKTYFNNQNYSDARTLFGSLTEDEVFGPYASFYYALASFRMQDVESARNMWLQILEKFPSWSQLDEVKYWQVYTEFENDNLARGVELANRHLATNQRIGFYKSYLIARPIPYLIGLLEQFPEDKPLAQQIINEAQGKFLPDDQLQVVEEIAANYGLTILPSMQFEEVKKSAYAVAVMLPFMYSESLTTVLRNPVVTDLYQGMLAAAEDLKEKNIEVNLYPFDTQKSEETTRQISQGLDFNEVDLVVGPLFTSPLEYMNMFSQQNNINLINPISNSLEAIEGNPFAFLMLPSSETIARQLALHCTKNYREGEVIIYYEDNRRDSTLAGTYKSLIENEGFKIQEFGVINDFKTRLLLDKFAAQQVRYLNIGAAQAEYLRKQGRNIKSRRKFDKNGNLELRADGTPKILYYEMTSRNEMDSLSHIVAITRNNLYVNNLVSALENQADSIGLIGMGEWLDFSMLAYGQLERLGVTLIDPEFVDRDSDFYKRVEASFLKRYKTRPSPFHLLGYECIWWSGHMMNRYGKFFQIGLAEDNSDIESLFSGIMFKGSQDNQVVPLIQFVEHKLQRINSRDESGSE